MGLEGIIRSELSLTEKDKYQVIPILCKLFKIELRDTEKSLVVARGRGRGGRVDDMSVGVPKVQTCSYKINSSEDINIQHGDCS